MSPSVETLTSHIPLLGMLLCGGLTAGFLAGLLGVGGGAVLVPILYVVFNYMGVEENIRMHLVLGTSFAMIAPTTLRSALIYWKKKLIDMSLLLRLGPWVSGGAILGVSIASLVHGETLLWIWIFGSGLMALKMSFGQKNFLITDTVSVGKALELSAFLIGLVSANLSIGGGMFFVPLLTLCSVPILTAIATSSGLGPLIGLPCIIGFMLAGLGTESLPPFSLGYVNLLAAGLIIPTSLHAVSWGVNLAHFISHRALELFFAVYLFGVSLNFLRKLF